MKIKIIGLLIALNSTSSLAENYDVLGRDMSYSETSRWSLINWIGHLGIEKDNKVYNMLPSPSGNAEITGFETYLHLTDIETFKNAGDNYWGTKYEDPTGDAHKIGDYLYIAKTVGVDYTFYAYNTSNPRVTYNSRTGTYNFYKGRLRCDSLVRNALVAGGHYKSSIITPAYVFNNVKNFR